MEETERKHSSGVYEMEEERENMAAVDPAPYSADLGPYHTDIPRILDRVMQFSVVQFPVTPFPATSFPVMAFLVTSFSMTTFPVTSFPVTPSSPLPPVTPFSPSRDVIPPLLPVIIPRTSLPRIPPLPHTPFEAP